MTFTDDDLKRLKDLASRNENPPWPGETMLDNEFIKALLARLEAAERFAKAPCYKCYYVGEKFRECYRHKVWRKSKGVDTDSLAEWDRKAAGK